MDQNGRELLFQLSEDVGIVANLLAPGSRPTPQAARTIIAPILRRWLCEGLFFKAQKLLLPHLVKFPLHEMKSMIRNCDRGLVEHWMSVVEMNGIGISSALPKPSEETESGFQTLEVGDDANANPSLRPAKFLINQRILYWKGRFFTRSEILAMHANRLGGVHLDFRRADDETHIDELTQYFGLEIIDSNHQMLVGGTIKVAKADPVRRYRTYDAMELVAIDTARIFTSGLKDSETNIAALLN